MARQDLERFRQIVQQQPTLQEQLLQAPADQAFNELALRLGAEHGCPFTAEELREALREARRTWLERWV
jgi:hypothetical protein